MHPQKRVKTGIPILILWLHERNLVHGSHPKIRNVSIKQTTTIIIIPCPHVATLNPKPATRIYKHGLHRATIWFRITRLPLRICNKLKTAKIFPM